MFVKSIGGFNLRYARSVKFMSAKKGCFFMSEASFLKPNLSSGFILNNYVKRDLALADR